MTIKPRGYEAVLKRMQEIQSRMKALEPERSPGPNPTAPPAAIQGAIGRGNQPLDPFAGTVVVRHLSPPPQMASMIRQAATRHGLDPLLFESLVAAESGFDPSVVSSAGAQGLAQLMPATAKMLGVSNPFDPAQNLDGGARYLAQMMRQFNGDARLALAAYNAGPGAVSRHGGVPPFQETRNYIDRILNRVRDLSGRTGP